MAVFIITSLKCKLRSSILLPMSPLSFHTKYEISLWLFTELRMEPKFLDKLYKALYDLATFYLLTNYLIPVPHHLLHFRHTGILSALQTLFLKSFQVFVLSVPSCWTYSWYNVREPSLTAESKQLRKSPASLPEAQNCP